MWDDEHYTQMEDVIAVEVRMLANNYIAHYYRRGEKLSRSESALVFRMERKGHSIRTFVALARLKARRQGILFVLGLDDNF